MRKYLLKNPTIANICSLLFFMTKNRTVFSLVLAKKMRIDGKKSF